MKRIHVQEEVSKEGRVRPVEYRDCTAPSNDNLVQEHHDGVSYPGWRPRWNW